MLLSARRVAKTSRQRKNEAMLRYLFSIVGALFFATATYGETITYVRTVSTTNFLGWGQTGFYFPQFDASSVVGPKRTDDNMQFFVPNWLEFNFDPLGPGKDDLLGRQTRLLR